MNEERLQKILARAGVTSRRKAEELIREGRVTVNGTVAGIGDKADLSKDAVKLDGKRIELPPVHRYLLLNKPRGVMSTVADPGGRPTVMDLVPPGLRKAMFPVGRLDFDTEGLILLTDDGDFAQRVAHPRHGCWKTYEVKVKGRPPAREIEKLEQGIPLEGRRTAPCRIRPRFGQGERRHGEEDDGNSWWIVELGEGRTRQIREMFFRIGHRVQKLRRVGIGPLFDPYLPVGGLRELSPEDVERLNRAAGGAKPAGVGKRTGGAAGRKEGQKVPAARRRREEKPMTLADVAKKQRSEAKRAVRVHGAPAPRPRPGGTSGKAFPAARPVGSAGRPDRAGPGGKKRTTPPAGRPPRGGGRPASSSRKPGRPSGGRKR